MTSLLLFVGESDLAKALGIGGAILIIVAGMVFAYLKTSPQRSHYQSGGTDKAGDRSVEYWQKQFEAIEKQLEQILEAVNNVRGDQKQINEILRERLHTLITLTSRIDTIVAERTGYPPRRTK